MVPSVVPIDIVVPTDVSLAACLLFRQSILSKQRIHTFISIILKTILEGGLALRDMHLFPKKQRPWKSPLDYIHGSNKNICKYKQMSELHFLL